MPKFSAFIPTPETVGDWEEMAFPAGTGAGSIKQVQPVAEVIAEMMSEAEAVLETQAANPLGGARGVSPSRHI